MALVDRTISSGDFSRIKTKISLAVTDAIFDRIENSADNNEAGRAAIVQKAAQHICDTLGITVLE